MMRLVFILALLLVLTLLFGPSDGIAHGMPALTGSPVDILTMVLFAVLAIPVLRAWIKRRPRASNSLRRWSSRELIDLDQ